MRYFLITLSIFYSIASNAQSYVRYKDTVNHFAIDIPKEWQYGASKNHPTVKLIASETSPKREGDLKSNFNLNILETPNVSLHETYDRLLESISKANNFKLVGSGDVVINGNKFKWLIEMHQNKNVDISMHDYVFVTYQNNKTYVLTFIASSNSFESFKEMFKKIANSLVLTE